MALIVGVTNSCGSNYFYVAKHSSSLVRSHTTVSVASRLILLVYIDPCFKSNLTAKNLATFSYKLLSWLVAKITSYLTS